MTCTVHERKLDMNLYTSGALCCMELERFGEAVQWCDEGLKVCIYILVTKILI